ncbi:MAG TPA: beta-ketoacyl synthase N-terminal-like domain-containing protein [Symbiobacteriaceae bacterium]|nr:beta-ketoacyl synthase N-terminal-like domain-containing protein [Symbiobacteriaceae bacterium]
MKRVVITGIGLLSTVGNTPGAYWESLLAGGEGLGSRSEQVEVPQVLSPGSARRMDRFGILTVTGAKFALDDSRILSAQPNMERIGCVFTTTCGALSSNMQFLNKLLTAGPDFTSPTVFSNTVSNAALGHTTVALGLKGPSTMLMSSSAVGYGFDLIRAGWADGLLAGGMDEYHAPIETAYRKKGVVAETESRPLDKERQGIKIREGVAMLFLEELGHALQRDARIVAEVVGYGGAFAPVSPERAKEPISSDPFAAAMRTALADAGVQPGEVDAIVMAAGGSVWGDLAEAQAVHTVFGERGATLPVTAYKGLLGDTFGSAATFGVLTGALVVASQTLPPTAGYQTPDEALKLNVTAPEPLVGLFQHVLVSSYDIGGNVAAILLKVPTEI